MPAKPRLTLSKLIVALGVPPFAVIALLVILVSGSQPAATTSHDDVAIAQPAAPAVEVIADAEALLAADPIDGAPPDEELVASDESAAEETWDEVVWSEDEGHVEEVLTAQAPPPMVAVAPAAPVVQPTARPAPTATPVPPPPPAAPISFEAEMLAAHNAERARAGVGALQMDATLTAAAQRRAQDMASRGYFAHVSPTGESISTILNINNYTILGENIARNTYPANQSVSVAMAGFLESASHRSNVLAREFTRIGIGVAVAGNQRYFAIVYANPR